jgi:hypothetical protein
MPYAVVSSNVAAARVDTSSALQRISKAVSEALGKPETYVMVQLQLDTPMMFQATEEVRLSAYHKRLPLEKG